MIFVYVTAENREEAERIGEALLEKKVAACINIIDGMTSLYWWEGKIEKGTEAILLIKTENNLFESVSDEVKSLHNYSVPCILEIPIGKGNPAYLDWLKQSLE